MAGVLKMARPHANVTVQPMFGEDYLDAYNPMAW
jgi:hypothetical protein